MFEENVIMDTKNGSGSNAAEVPKESLEEEKKEKNEASPEQEITEEKSKPSAMPEASPVKQLRVGGKDLETINDDHFAKVRAHFHIPNDFAPTEEDLSFAKLSSAGGKGGDPMTSSKDKKFFVKELNKADSQVLEDLAKDLCQHITW